MEGRGIQDTGWWGGEMMVGVRTGGLEVRGSEVTLHTSGVKYLHCSSQSCRHQRQRSDQNDTILVHMEHIWMPVWREGKP